MRIIYILCFVILSKKNCAQKPAYKMFIDAKPYEIFDQNTSVEARTDNAYFSILDSAKEIIDLPKNVDFNTIKDFRFIVKNDTVIITVDEILGNAENRNDEIQSMFKELKNWEIYIDYFPFDDIDVLALVNEELEVTHGAKSDYKVYILHTINWKYSVIKI